ncbi:MAG TPA: DUF3568 family protein [Gemmatimonas sp.]|nr:DUF3568 family protein [Gemmatimonas sp.]
MPRRVHFVLPLALMLSAGSLSGCLLAAAGAGAAGAVAYSNRGATSDVALSVDSTFTRTLNAFSALKITETGRSTDDNGATRRLTGKQGDIEVTVEMKRSTPTMTKIEVVARESAVDYDPDFAKTVLSRILP